MDEFDELAEALEKPVEKSDSDHWFRRNWGVEPTDEAAEAVSGNVVQWSYKGKSVYIPTTKTTKELPSGVYEVRQDRDNGTYFQKIPVKTEGLLRFPDTNSDKVIMEIQKFWTSGHHFKKYGLPHKRGIILWGPPGSGKSSILQLIMEDVVSRGGIVIKFDEPYMFVDGMRLLRQIQPDTPVVVTMEDIDSIIEDHSETEVLNILDGINYVEKVVFLATTNYPNRLGARVINRPSRFDKRFKIGHPNKQARRMYLENILKNNDDPNISIDLDKWVEDTKGYSMAHIKELFVAVVIFGDSYKDAIHTLNSMKEKVESTDENIALGFRPQTDEEED